MTIGLLTEPGPMRPSIAGRAVIFVQLVATSLWKSPHTEEVVVAAKGGPERSSTTGIPAMIRVPRANGIRRRFPGHWSRTPIDTGLHHAQRAMSLQREWFVLVQQVLKVILCNLPHALHLVPTIQRHPQVPKDVPRSWGGSFVLVNGTKYVCQTCVLSIDSTTSTMTTTPTTTTSTTSLPVTGSTGSVREWEEFAGPFNRVCRGAGPTDNNPAYFEVRQEIPDVEACKELCLQELGQEGCKGVEYNVLSKRCELWKRNEGIWAFDYPKMEGFSCLRYGWPGKYLIPVNGGLNQACRGPDGKNSASFYVVEAVRHMEDCRARCVAARLCKGVEYSKGRCEIWHSEVATTEARTGFECLRYEPPDVPEPVAEQPMH